MLQLILLNSPITERLPLLLEYFCSIPKLQFKKPLNKKEARFEARL